MAAFTSSQSGNWSSSSTWGGAGVPGDGDTVSIGAHTVTVDVNATVGTSPNDTTTKAVNLTSASSVLVIAAGVTLTAKGSIGHVNGSTHTQQAGSTLTFDNSGSGGSPVYTFINAGFSQFNFNGTSGLRVTVQAITGRAAGMGVPWSNFAAAYTDFRRITSLGTANNLTSLSITDCTFDGCGRINPTATSASINFVFDRNTFTNGTHATEDVNFAVTTAATSGTRSISANVFTKSVTYATSKSFQITQNYFGGGFQVTSGATYTSFRLNFVKQNDTLNSGNGGNGGLMPQSFERNYFLIDNTTGNPHFVEARATAADTVVSQNIFESQSPDLVDIGDAVILIASGVSGGFKVVGRNNIVLPSGAGPASGTMLTLYNAASSVVSEWYRGTVNVNTSTPTGKRAAFAVAEANTGFAGQVAALKSNVGWGSSSGQGYLAERRTGNVKDILTSGGVDYNWTHNLSAGDNQRGYEDAAASNTLWTAGDAAAAGADAHQGTGNPSFYDSSRNLAAWAVARGYGSTYSDGLTALRADPTRTADLINYVFEGFRPGNASMRSAAHDGGCVGASNYYKSSRTLSRVATHRTGLSKFGL